MKKVILDLCGGSGAWSEPYRQSSEYEVRLITLPDYDVRTFELPIEAIHGILAAPPCTAFSFALNEKIKRDLNGGLEIVRACLSCIEKAKTRGLQWWAVENPYGHLVRFLGRPTFIFQPWEFGDPWTKRTAIWGEFALPSKTHTNWSSVTKNPRLYVRPGRGKPNFIWLHKSAKEDIPAFAPFKADTDADFRSLTPQGFARAFFEVNP